MKLASLKGGRDGRLCVVSQDLKLAVLVPDIAHTMQQALDNWQQVFPQLQAIYHKINARQQPQSFPFDPTQCAAPLPRAFQWADGSAYVNHVELIRKSRNAELPKEFWTDPLMYQGGSDTFLGPTDAIPVVDEAYGIDFEAEIAIITDDVPMATSADQARQHILLLMLVNDVSLRNLIPQELAKGFGFFHAKPSTGFSPVAVTPDELGNAWDGERVHLPVYSYLNNQLFGQPNAGIDMTFSFPQLLAHAAKTRALSTGTIIGSGTVSNLDRSSGSSCIAEKRMLEIIEHGHATTPFMRFGDTIRIEVLNQEQNVFGTIQQEVVRYGTV